MNDAKAWPTSREKTDLAGQFAAMRRERDEWKHKALWLHGKYINEEAKVAEQMDRAEAVEAEVERLTRELATEIEFREQLTEANNAHREEVWRLKAKPERLTALVGNIRSAVDSARGGTSFDHAKALGEIDELLAKKEED